MDKILFLDIDGVVCTPRSFHAYGLRKWDPTACEMIKKICLANSYKIVCSSSWRFDGKVTQAWFKHYGLKELLHPGWCTTLKELSCRGEEIQDWLNKHKDSVAEFVILDDDSDMLPEQLSRFIKTDSENGLSCSNFVEANKLMGGKVL
jgi:hypothetical protein